MSKIDDATLNWACTLISGVILTTMFCFSVWSARRTALEVNGIVLTPWWYFLALLGPLLSITIALLIPRTNRVWQRALVSNILSYTYGGFVRPHTIYV